MPLARLAWSFPERHHRRPSRWTPRDWSANQSTSCSRNSAGSAWSPRLVWVTSGAHAPGTALSVQPGGRLLPGTIAVVTAAAQFVQQGDQNGGAGAEPGGGGNGGGDGGSDGNGGGGGGH